MKIRNLAILGGLMVAAGMATVACSGDDDDTSAPKTDAGTDGSVLPTDSGVKSDSSTGDAGSDASAIPNHAAVLGFVQSVVTDQIEHNGGAVLSYFVPNTVTGHSPSLPDIEDCLAYQFGFVVGNGDTYPPTFADGGAEPLADGYLCRASMSAIHQPLGIPGDIFDQFVGDITTEAMIKGVTFTSTQSMEILGLKSQIIDPNAPDGAAYGWEDAGADAAPVDAGSDADAH
jgi:hypothetical protein